MKTVETGKKNLIAIIILLLLTNVITTICLIVYGQADEMGANTFFGLVRFAFAGSILYFLYAGNKVAKWLIVVITLFNGINGVITVLLNIHKALIFIAVLSMVISIIYIAIGIVLIISNPVNNFLSFKREEDKAESNKYKSEK